MAPLALVQPITPQVQTCPNPKKVLFVGDSLMKQSAWEILIAFHLSGRPIQSMTMAYGGSNAVAYSFIEPGPWFWPTPRDELRYWLQNYDPDIVICNWGVNKIESMWGGPDAWLMQWARDNAMQEVKQMCQDAGAQLYWANIPRCNVSDFGLFLWIEDTNNKIHQMGVPVINWREATSDVNGNFSQFLKYPEDNLDREVRWSDGIHLTTDGARRVARWTTKALANNVC